MANTFTDSFIITTAEIRDTINSDISFMSETVVRDADVVFKEQPLTQLERSTQDEIRHIIIVSIKQVLEHVFSLIIAVINESLVQSVVLHCFKNANVRPLLTADKFR